MITEINEFATGVILTEDMLVARVVDVTLQPQQVQVPSVRYLVIEFETQTERWVADEAEARALLPSSHRTAPWGAPIEPRWLVLVFWCGLPILAWLGFAGFVIALVLVLRPRKQRTGLVHDGRATARRTLE